MLVKGFSSKNQCGAVSHFKLPCNIVIRLLSWHNWNKPLLHCNSQCFVKFQDEQCEMLLTQVIREVRFHLSSPSEQRGWWAIPDTAFYLRDNFLLECMHCEQGVLCMAFLSSRRELYKMILVFCLAKPRTYCYLLKTDFCSWAFISPPPPVVISLRQGREIRSG